jgi:hypothetical protein
MVPVAVLATSVALAGCGQGAITPATVVTQRLDAATPAKPAKPAQTARPSIARREARHLLTLLRLPTGSHGSSSPPAGSGSLLNAPGQTPGTPNLVDLHRFYVVPMAAQATLSWIKSNLPQGASLVGTSVSSGGSTTTYEIWGITLSWPVDGKVLDTAELNIELLALSGHRSALRVDSQVVWLPAKNRYDFVPSTVTRLTVTVVHPPSPVKPITTTTLSTINRFRHAIARLSVMPAGTFHCPADFAGSTIRLAFRQNAGGAPVAVVEADGSGCGIVTISLGSKQGTELWGGRTIVQLAEHLLGLHLAGVPGS